MTLDVVRLWLFHMEIMVYEEGGGGEGGSAANVDGVCGVFGDFVRRRRRLLDLALDINRRALTQVQCLQYT